MSSNRVTVTSFGFGHSAPPPEADLTIDARRHLRNPHRDPRMRQMTGLDDAVREHVFATPGARELVAHTTATARDLLVIATEHPVTVAVGCVGGRHRSVAIAQKVGEVLRAEGIAVEITHRDVTKPVIQP